MILLKYSKKLFSGCICQTRVYLQSNLHFQRLPFRLAIFLSPSTHRRSHSACLSESHWPNQSRVPEMARNGQPKSDGLQPTSDGLVSNIV